jgi:hypothetical protein
MKSIHVHFSVKEKKFLERKKAKLMKEMGYKTKFDCGWREFILHCAKY